MFPRPQNQKKTLQSWFGRNRALRGVLTTLDPSHCGMVHGMWCNWEAVTKATATLMLLWAAMSSGNIFHSSRKAGQRQRLPSHL